MTFSKAMILIEDMGGDVNCYFEGIDCRLYEIEFNGSLTVGLLEEDVIKFAESL